MRLRHQFNYHGVDIEMEIKCTNLSSGSVGFEFARCYSSDLVRFNHSILSKKISFESAKFWSENFHFAYIYLQN